ncbi:DUF2087 domain-containing protein [Altericista sp. CCNU0014]|uniref:DUF2087 domain-containing protein n=1 Tax=Altericista sp. CCNU0014 TaxID=3082949 RepID=UPI00384D19AD
MAASTSCSGDRGADALPISVRDCERNSWFDFAQEICCSRLYNGSWRSSNAIAIIPREVNTRLKQHPEDCATLRRELTGYRLMSCNRNVCRRLSEAEWLSEIENFN